jgi:hypothetical protein
MRYYQKVDEKRPKMACLCGNWLRYQPVDEDEDDDDDICEDEYENMVIPAIKKAMTQQPKGSVVSNAIADFEKKKEPSPTKQRIEREERNASRPSPSPAHAATLPTSYTGIALSKASSIFGRFYSRTATSPNAAREESKSMLKPRSFKVVPSQDDGHRCRICRQKFFPTDKITTAQKQEYHAACFKCTLCGSKLKNDPDEDHMLINAEDAPYHPILHIILQCQRCKLDNEQKYKPRTQSTVAGQKVVVGETEQGDIEQVVDLIGDELEDALCGMIPRCSTCGGDFLTYKGEISMLGALKYHTECWQMGKPALGFQASMTLQPLQAAKYLPNALILRLSSPDNGKVLSSLFFVWTNKDDQLKALRAQKNESVRVFFHLDEEARANPNNSHASRKKRFADIPPGQDPDHPSLQVDIINDQIAPKSPGMVGPSSIVYSKELASSVLRAQVAYDMFNLHHVISLNVPCTPEQGKLDLAGASVTAHIEPMGSV